MGSLGYWLPFHLYVTGISGLSAALLQAVQSRQTISARSPAPLLGKITSGCGAAHGFWGCIGAPT